MLTCAITDRHLFTGTEPLREAALETQLRRLSAPEQLGERPGDEEVRNPVTFFQLREKDLAGPELGRLLRRLREALPVGSPTRLLLNGPAAVAAAHGADGVHLPGGWSPAAVMAARRAFSGVATVTASAHTIAEASLAPAAGVDALLFGPVFGKTVRGESVQPGTGLELLAEAVRAAVPVPVLALGGVRRENVADCLAAGAAGVAAIRLFL